MISLYPHRMLFGAYGYVRLDGVCGVQLCMKYATQKQSYRHTGKIYSLIKPFSVMIQQKNAYDIVINKKNIATYDSTF